MFECMVGCSVSLNTLPLVSMSESENWKCGVSDSTSAPGCSPVLAVTLEFSFY